MKTTEKPLYQSGDWIVVRGMMGEEKVVRALFDHAPRDRTGILYIRYATSAEVAVGEAKEAAQERARQERESRRATPEYTTASRLLSMDEESIINQLGPELLAQIAAKLDA